MSSKKEKFARFGIATKGVVYVLIGGLSAMTAFGMGGEKTGSSGVIEFLSTQAFSQVLLVVTAIGLSGYVFYRIYQAIKDPHSVGNGAKGILVRLGYAASGLFYGGLAVTAISIVTGTGGSGSGNSNESAVATLLGQSFGQIFVGILAAIFLGKAIFQFYKAYSGKLKEQVDSASLDSRTRDIVLKTGKVGYTSRGLVIGIIAFLTFRAALTASSSEAGGTEDAFQFLQNEFGTIVLLVISLGLLAYGFFMFVKARYSKLAIS